MWYRNYSTSSTSQLQVHFENPHLPLAFDWSPSPYCIHNFSKPWEPSSISGCWEIFSRTKLIAFCISKRWGMVIRELGLNCRAAGLRSNLFYLSSFLKGSWWQRNTVYKIIISNGNRSEWSTIQGVIGQVISNGLGWFEISNTITPELCDVKTYCQLIVSITKCETS